LRKQSRRRIRRADASASGARFEPISRLGIITHGGRCLNKTFYLTAVLWWFFKGWQSFIRCIGHCTWPYIFYTIFWKLALRPWSGNWLPLYWQKLIFFFNLLLVTTVWMQSMTVSGLLCAPTNHGGVLKRTPPPKKKSPTTDSNLKTG
jgi:hypothetical protein